MHLFNQNIEEKTAREEWLVNGEGKENKKQNYETQRFLGSAG